MRTTAYRELDQELTRYQTADFSNWRNLVPWFSTALEHRFEADTRASREREINITLTLGVVFYWLTLLSDFAFMPDIGLSGILLRALPLPLLFVVLLLGPRLSCPAREWLLTGAGVVTVLTLAALPMYSSASSSSLAFYPPMLAILYGNTTIVARFSKSLVFTTVCCLTVAVLAVIHSGVQSPIGWAIGLLACITGASGLISNYRSERAARLAYLLNKRESERLAAAAADREKLRTLSDTDALTGLANRGAFDRRCRAAFLDPRNTRESAAMLMLDLDHFKSFNDHYGHLAGDNCLRAVAQRISEEVRAENDIAARYGGEEFILFLPNTSREQAKILAKRICSAVRELNIPHRGRNDQVTCVTISIGIAATTITDPTQFESLVDAADRALYAAKRSGRDCYEAAFIAAA